MARLPDLTGMKRARKKRHGAAFFWFLFLAEQEKELVARRNPAFN